MAGPVALVVGLGNPGDRYEGTRHNAGADLVTALASAHGETLKAEKRFSGRAGRIAVGGADLRLLVPDTFYNGSGDAVGPLLRFYRIPVERMLVVHDELDLPPGVARLKQGGGHGGNNGVRDILRALGGEADFGRLRLGVGHPGDRARVTGYLLTRAPADERRALEEAVDESLRVLGDLVEGRWEAAMTELHTRTREKRAPS